MVGEIELMNQPKASDKTVDKMNRSKMKRLLVLLTLLVCLIVISYPKIKSAYDR